MVVVVVVGKRLFHTESVAEAVVASGFADLFLALLPSLQDARWMEGMNEQTDNGSAFHSCNTMEYKETLGKRGSIGPYEAVCDNLLYDLEYNVRKNVIKELHPNTKERKHETIYCFLRNCL